MTYLIEMFGGPGRLRTYDNPVMSRIVKTVTH